MKKLLWKVSSQNYFFEVINKVRRPISEALFVSRANAGEDFEVFEEVPHPVEIPLVVHSVD